MKSISAKIFSSLAAEKVRLIAGYIHSTSLDTIHSVHLCVLFTYITVCCDCMELVEKVIKELNERLAESEATIASAVQVCSVVFWSF